mmetsp:Transcript_21504/g.26385  ORF Transcript_21504/g.26385 Transcript_21504/m.26385 type:complete len:181 (+) Transcript_21504:143-685(+)
MKDHKLWDQRYYELCEYRRLYGDTNVPRRYEVNPQLGVWVSNQRQYYKKYKTGISGWGMTDSRIKRLEDAGFEWVLSSGRSLTGLNNLHVGNGNESATGTASNTTTGAAGTGSSDFADQQQAAQERIDSRKSRIQETMYWDKMFDELVEYKRSHDHTNVPRKYDVYPELGKWVHAQKRGF